MRMMSELALPCKKYKQVAKLNRPQPEFQQHGYATEHIHRTLQLWAFAQLRGWSEDYKTTYLLGRLGRTALSITAALSKLRMAHLSGGTQKRIESLTKFSHAVRRLAK